MGMNVQFSAQVSGLSNTAVTWSVANAGAVYGTITSAGLYTAPATVPPSVVTLTATSVANPQIHASAIVNILGAGPTLTSVSPNPLPSGAFTVTLQGSGFQAGATAFTVSGSTYTPLTTTFVNSTTVTATGNQSTATSLNFSVRNSNSLLGNVVTVPVTTAGTGSGGTSPPAGVTVTVTPYTPMVGIGQTQQFSAQVSGSANTAVTWSVYNAGAVNGTITSSGLYTAPATMPPSGEAEIVATSIANPQAVGYAYAYLLGAGPTITSVSPNPLAVGTFTVTIQGSGFQTGVTAGTSWGSNSLIGLPTTLVNSTTLTATGYQGPATSASFFVRNPSSMYSNTLTVPVGPPQYTLSVVNGSGSGSYTAGASVTIVANAPPAGEVFQSWSGTAVQNANSATTTLTMPASSATVTAQYIAPPSIPYPVTSHPRLWITPGDLPRLQSWATASNPVYQNGLLPALNLMINAYTTQYFPNGVPNPNYPDNGDVFGFGAYVTEQQALVFALNSLIDPDPNARIRYAQYARNLLMYAMNQAALGHLAGAPFRDPSFAIINRANGQGEQWPLIVDWIYNATDSNGKAILTASDKATIRNVFMMWANDCLNAEVSGGDHPSPPGLTNNLQLLPNGQAYRYAANNYYLGHARQVTMMALAMDPVDDPPVNASVPGALLGNSLRSYIPDATGAWLYQEFAMFGDPGAVASAYGIPGAGAGLGLASGGMPPEGPLYGNSLSFVLGQLLALQTAGFNNPVYSGPQIQLIGAPVWDRFITGYLSGMLPAAKVFPVEAWLGPVYQFGGYGEFLRLFVTPEDMRSFALLTLLEQQNGHATHAAAARWFSLNAEQGGPASFYNRMTNPYSFTETVLYYLLFDPAAAPATDPRPSYPTMFVDPAAGRVIAHSDWTPNGVMFDYRASWTSIDHQNGDAGQFEFYRNGEWLTKEMSGYDPNEETLRSSMFHNTLSLQHTCPDGTPTNLRWWEGNSWSTGSQFLNSAAAGDPSTVTSTGPGYVYAASDLTGAYNRPNQWSAADSSTNTALATRSIVWLNNDYIVVYDRATSVGSGAFKRDAPQRPAVIHPDPVARQRDHYRQPACR
jgi:hypothetical protein